MKKLTNPKSGHFIKWFDSRLNVPKVGQEVLIVDKYKCVRLAYYRVNTYGETEGFIDKDHPEQWQKRPIIDDTVLYWSYFRFSIPNVLENYLIGSKEAYLD